MLASITSVRWRSLETNSKKIHQANVADISTNVPLFLKNRPKPDVLVKFCELTFSEFKFSEFFPRIH